MELVGIYLGRAFGRGRRRWARLLRPSSAAEAERVRKEGILNAYEANDDGDAMAGELNADCEVSIVRGW